MPARSCAGIEIVTDPTFAQAMPSAHCHAEQAVSRRVSRTQRGAPTFGPAVCVEEPLVVSRRWNAMPLAGVAKQEACLLPAAVIAAAEVSLRLRVDLCRVVEIPRRHAALIGREVGEEIAHSGTQRGEHLGASPVAR